VVTMKKRRSLEQAPDPVASTKKGLPTRRERKRQSTPKNKNRADHKEVRSTRGGTTITWRS